MIPRRALLQAMAAAAALGCDKEQPQNDQPAPRYSPSWKEVAFPPSATYGEPQHAAVLVEGEGPLLVALHGRGEAGRGLEVGARGWRDDYHLDRARERLKAPPLSKDDLGGFVTAERLAVLNRSLAAHPYGGLTVACPYTPALFDRSLAGAASFAAFVTQTLLPKARTWLSAPGKSGIDGVSMGGRLALLVGLSHPGTFSTVGALQPAIGRDEVGWLVDLARKGVDAGVRLRLVTSTDDAFRDAVEAYAEALERAGVQHELLVTEGPHDYSWNRGPGAYEMLLWHDRVLRGWPPPR